MNRKTISILIIVVAVILAIVGYFLLPETCITQIGPNPSHMSKIPAILIPFAISVVFSLFYMKSDNNNNTRNLIGALLGIAIFLLLFFINR